MFNRTILMALHVAFAGMAIAQDNDDDIRELMRERDKAIAAIDAEFLQRLAVKREEKLEQLRGELEVAMKSLDLEKSNEINQEMKEYSSLKPTIDRRNVFVRINDRDPSEVWLFVRGVNGIWLECTPTTLFRYDQTLETPEFIEIVHENGSTHRIYQTKEMHRDVGRGKKSFEFAARGHWVSGSEIRMIKAEMGEPKR